MTLNALKPGTREFNEQLIHRVFDELYNQGYFTAVEKIEEFVHPNFRDLGPNSPRVGRGPRAFAACNEVLGAIPGEAPTWKMEEMIHGDDNTVVVRWTARKSEHTSSGITIYRLNEQGQIREAYTEWNALAIQRSAGFLPEGIGIPLPD